MYITEEGREIINNLSGVIYQLKGITELEDKLKIPWSGENHNNTRKL